METFKELERDEPELGVRSDWILTYTGRQFCLGDPRPEDVDIEDIAHALSLICRFTGHCLRFYSVAEHSLLVVRNLPKKCQAWGLLHDAAEAYVNDLARPLKTSARLSDYRLIEDRILYVVLGRFGLQPRGLPGAWIPPEVKQADLRALATERRDLMNPSGPEWNLGVEPYEQVISTTDQYGIKTAFLAQARELGLE